MPIFAHPSNTNIAVLSKSALQTCYNRSWHPFYLPYTLTGVWPVHQLPTFITSLCLCNLLGLCAWRILKDSLVDHIQNPEKRSPILGCGVLEISTGRYLAVLPPMLMKPSQISALE